MKIEKAIELLQREQKLSTLSPDPDVPDALQLGIEALKFVAMWFAIRNAASETEE